VIIITVDYKSTIYRCQYAATLVTKQTCVAATTLSHRNRFHCTMILLGENFLKSILYHAILKLIFQVFKHYNYVVLVLLVFAMLDNLLSRKG